jgi:hypothetical protein
MPASDDWYRSPSWDPAAQTEFRRRIARARGHNQVQYRRIKALALLGTDDADRQRAGRELLAEVIDADDAPFFEQTMAMRSVAAHDHSVGRLDDAEQLMRVVIRRLAVDPSGGDGEEAIELAEILIEGGDPARTMEAAMILDRLTATPPTFPRSVYRMGLAGVTASLALGDRARAAVWARSALQAAARTDSGFRHHPRIGLVDAPAAELRWLRTIAGAPPID